MRLALLALALSACTTRPIVPWTVRGDVTLDLETQALAIAAAAKRVYPGTALDYGGKIVVTDQAARACYGAPWADLPISGCVIRGGVVVLWPHPRCPLTADLTCSALGHELAHYAGFLEEAAADAGSLRILAEYRKGNP